MKTLSMVCAVASMSPSFVLGQVALNDEGRPRISVTGEAVVNVKPDQVIINFGIETNDVDMAVSKQKNTGILHATVSAMTGLGIAAADLQTDHLSIEPRWDTNASGRTFLGYFIRNNLMVTISDTERIEAVVTKALEAGVNYIHGLDFQTTNLRQHRDEARGLALKAAKEKAEKMAAALGGTIGKPLNINEIAWGSPWRYYSSWSGWGWGHGRSSGMSQINVQVDRGDSSELSGAFALGKLAISANVSVIFELK